MTNRSKTTTATVTAWAAGLGLTLAVVGAAGGCQKKEPGDRAYGNVFRQEWPVRTTDTFNNAQAAAGARADGTLRPHHFDGENVNTLGERKLELMLRDDDACTPITIYLDLPKDGYDDRADAVTMYLRGRGLQDGQVKLVAGPNVTNTTPTVQAMRGKRLIDSGAPVAVNPEPAGSAGAMAGGR